MDSSPRRCTKWSVTKVCVGREVSLGRDLRAQIDVATTAVFIVTVGLAAVAAAVLFSTSVELRGEGPKPDDHGLDVVSVLGRRDSVGVEALHDLEIYLVSPSDGDPVDLAQMEILISDGGDSFSVGYAEARKPGAFTATALRDVDRGFTGAEPVMTSGDLVRLDLALDGTASPPAIMPGVEVRVMLVPEGGAPLPLTFTAPESYGSRLAVALV